METGYIMAFMTGIIGGFGHCIGMCGPLVASYTMTGSRQFPSPVSRMIPHVLYNTGRITTYMLIGGLMGLSGSFINIAGRLAHAQNAVAILAGIMMILMGLSIMGMIGTASWLEKHNVSVIRIAAGITASASPFRFYPLGLTLGLLPCGLSYTIFIAAAATGSLLSGMATALLFGIGTLPALLIFGALISALGASLRGRIYRAGGALIMLMGIYYLYRGISLYARV